MKLTKPLQLLLLSGSVAYASSLAVYQDQALYTFSPKNNYIGFSEGVNAKCEGSTIPLTPVSSCPSEDRLCQLLTNLKHTEKKLESVQVTSKMLAQLVSLPQPTTVDAESLIKSSKQIGEEQARLLQEERLLSDQVLIQEQRFEKQAPSKYASGMIQTCHKEIELMIPYGFLFFSTQYQADITDEKEVTVTQYLSVTNRSGIDIKADSAMFYYRSANQNVYPTHFAPWLVRKYEPEPLSEAQPPEEMARRYKEKKAMKSRARVQTYAPIVSYEDAREYKIKNLILPSTGTAVELEVLKWKAPLSCEVRSYAYENTQAFHVCSFQPKYQIDTNRWKVKNATEVINENALGEYWDGKYDLYTNIEEDIKIDRKPIVNKERETGIFGGTVRKKDGFILTVTNKSDKTKKLTIIERIPTSTTEEIQSKLLSITSEQTVNYKINEDGQIEIKLSLEAQEKKEIEVLFEISYDKDVKVKY